MIKRQIVTKDILWGNLVDAASKSKLSPELLHRAEQSILKDIALRTEVVRHALVEPNFATPIAIDLISKFTVDEQLSLLPELVYRLCHCHIGDVQGLENIILSLPRDRVLERIDDAGNSAVRDGGYWEYLPLLSLYEKINQNLMIQLAYRALQHSDDDLKEVAGMYLTPDK